MSKLEDWVTMDEAVEQTGCSRQSIYRWLADSTNGIRTHRPRRMRYLNLSDLLRVNDEMAERVGRPRKTAEFRDIAEKLEK